MDLLTRCRSREGVGTFQHAYLEIMSAITQASAQVAKTVAVTTGKVANAKSMMIWRPHGNKYVNARATGRERNPKKRRARIARPVVKKGSSRGARGRRDARDE